MTDDDHPGRPRDPDDVTFQGAYDWARVSPADAVVEALSVATGRDQSDLEPLYGHVDPEAIDAFFGASTPDTPPPTRCLVFRYRDYDVTVSGSGEIEIRFAPEPEAGGARGDTGSRQGRDPT